MLIETLPTLLICRPSRGKRQRPRVGSSLLVLPRRRWGSRSEACQLKGWSGLSNSILCSGTPTDPVNRSLLCSWEHPFCRLLEKQCLAKGNLRTIQRGNRVSS
jgi:hypothetical protein